MSFTTSLVSLMLQNRPWITGIQAGIVVHQAVFKRGEWHMYGPQLVNIHLAACIVVFAVKYLTGLKGLWQCLWDTLELSTSYIATLFLSIWIYRIFFSPLRSFSGPWLAKVSKLWHIYRVRDGKNHLFLEDMHQKYGEFVRTGPNELTVYHPDIHRLLDGPGSDSDKSAFYDILLPLKSLAATKDHDLHREKRKIWHQALQSECMSVYQDKMLAYVDLLSNYLDRSSKEQKSVNVRDAFFWFCWDLTGDIAWSKSFGMLENEEWDKAVVDIRRTLKIFGTCAPAPWLFSLAFKYLHNRWVLREWEALKALTKRLVHERLQKPNPDKDMFGPMISEAKSSGVTTEDLNYLTGDALVALLAGSDPTASHLIFLFSHLARSQQIQNDLVKEIATVDVRDAKSLKSCTLLNSLIQETFRMYPATMTTGLRDTGPNGLQVGDVYIPEGTTICSPKFSISRLESCFTDPDEFRPERWTTHPELVQNSRVSTPFGVGSRSCVAKTIVWTLLRFTIAGLVSRYHVRLAPNEDGTRAYKELKDYMLPCPGPLELVFEKRG